MPLLEECKLEELFPQYRFPQSFFPLFNRSFISIPQFFRPLTPVNIFKMSFYGSKEAIIIQPMGILSAKSPEFMIFRQVVFVFPESNSKDFIFILSSGSIINPFFGKCRMILYVRFQKGFIFH